MMQRSVLRLMQICMRVNLVLRQVRRGYGGMHVS